MFWDKLFKRKKSSDSGGSPEAEEQVVLENEAATETDNQDEPESPVVTESQAEEKEEADEIQALLAGMGELSDIPDTDIPSDDDLLSIVDPSPSEASSGVSEEEYEDDIPDDLFEDFDKRFQELETDINLHKRMAEKQILSDDIDSQIEQLLDKDNAEPLTSEGQTDFISEVSIFNKEKGIISASEYNARDPDTARKRGQAEDEEPSISVIQKIMNLPPKTLYIVMAVLGVLIIGFGVTTFVLADRVHKAEQEQKKLTNPLTPGNSSSFIYIYEQVLIEGEPLVLEKIMIDSLCTQFYFTQYFDAFRYEMMLFDDQEKVYQMDLNHLKDALSEEKKGPTVLQFEAFDPHIKAFTLRIHDPMTEQDMDFQFAFSESLVLPSARYINESTEVYMDDDISIMVEPSHFSRAGSMVCYSINWRDDNGSVRFEESNDRNILLSEESRTVLRNNISPMQQSFADEQLILGRVEFDPLTNLDARIKLTFNNLFRSFNVNATIPTDKLLQDQEGLEEIINLGPYRIVMERIVRQGNLVILVLHTEEKVTIPDQGSGSALDDSEDHAEQTAPKRIQTELDAELHVTLGSGVQAILKGQNFSGEIGTDVVFNMSAYDNFNIGTPQEMTIAINSASFKMNDITVPIDLYNQSMHEQGEASEAASFIKDAFEKRLRYKSGQAGKDELTGFTSPVLADEQLMADYAPEKGADQSQFSVQVAINYLSEDKMLAIVRETWAMPGSNQEDVFYRIHKVEAEKDQKGWRITDDKLVQDDPLPLSDTYFSP